MRDNECYYSKAFYTLEVINRAISDYKGIASITLTSTEAYYRCVFNKCVVDTQRVVLEFNNYLIELLNMQGENIEA